MQVTLGDQVLQQVDQGGAGVSASVKVDHIVGATELKERLQLVDAQEESQSPTPSSLYNITTFVLHSQSSTLKETQVTFLENAVVFKTKDPAHLLFFKGMRSGRPVGLRFIPPYKHLWSIKTSLVNPAAGSGAFLFKFKSKIGLATPYQNSARLGQRAVGHQDTAANVSKHWAHIVT